MVSEAFRYMLESYSDLKIVSECGDGKSAISEQINTRPDIVLMDVLMQGMSGLDVTRRILVKDPDAKIIILSVLGSEAAVRAIEAGARGFLSKDSPAKELYTAIRRVQGGHIYIDAATAQQMAMDSINGVVGSLKVLSPREYEVFVHLANGVSVESIASSCYMSPKTVRSHKSHIMRKLGLDNTIDFVRFAIQTGVIGDKWLPPE